ncbi:MAG TPA: adenylate/guanylate cyclase domain-containing protein [Gaiellaceae bacterium]|nr:adenylate/guanylate cyclase domain-containing protein [Gaiellaceae bacterium]
MSATRPDRPSRAAGHEHRLTPYVPRLVVDWLRETPAARTRRLEGSLAFVDISGFTQLTERLSRKGKVGAEEMNDLLDACFAAFLSEAYEFGAGVVKWGGDAVLLLFDGDGHEARACRAAFGMRRVLRSVGRLETSSGRVTLRMSVGIHSGAFDVFLVGDLHRELVITGPGATRTVELEAAAQAGEIAIGVRTAAALPSGCVGGERGPGLLLRRAPDVGSLRAAPVGDVSGIDLGACLPVEVREHILAGGGEAEHRPMTAAFVHFTGTDELLERDGPEAVADALEACIGCVQRVAHEHRVSFFETDVAANGGKIMLMAGAPRSAGDDEERMLRAMRAILEAGGPLPLRIGVHRGRIFVGDFGPPYRRTYSVKGDAVNLAARLMARAEPGQLLTTADVLDRSPMRFELAALEPFRAKGKSALVQAFAVGAPTGVEAGRHREAPLVGREAELGALRAALARARDGHGGAVELVGERGLGKSRLVGELVRAAEPTRTIVVRCDEYETATPYFALAALLRSLLELPRDPVAAADTLHGEVEQAAPELRPWLPLLAAALGLRLPDTPETAALEERFRRERLEEAAVALVGSLLDGPALLVFEDAHWLDDASAEALGRLLPDLRRRPWLVVVTRRDQRTGFSLAEAAQPARLVLEPLAGDAALALLHAVTEEEPLPPHQAAALSERGAGNPLFLLELVAAARAAGAVDELPDSLEAVMMAHIDRLAAADRRVLRAAAVVGATCRLDLLEACLGGERLDGETLARLGEFLADDGDGRLRFRHALARDAAYEGLAYRRRRELHAVVGDTLQRLAGSRPEAEAEHLSLHYFHAQRFREAWEHSRTAAHSACEVYANAEAATFLERALASARHLRDVPAEEVARVWEALGDARRRLAEFDRAARAFRAARRTTGAGPVSAAQLMLKEAMVPYVVGRYPQALRWLTRALRALDGVDGEAARAQRARLHAWSGMVRLRQGKPVRAIAACRRALEEADEVAAARDAVAHACYLLDWAYAALGRLEEAVYSQTALAIYEQQGNLGGQGDVLNNRGVIAHMRGHWDESLAFYQRAQAAYERAGNVWAATFAQVNAAEILSDQGRLEEAEPLLRDALRVARASGSAARVADVSAYLGRVLARGGRFDEAQALLADAREQYVRDGNQSELLATDARIADSLVLRGEAEAALHVAEAALERAAASDGLFVLLAALERSRGCALFLLGRLDEAAEALATSLAEARSKGAAYEVALTLDALAALRARTGEPAGDLARERDGIFSRLGVVRTSPVPLPEPEPAAAPSR